LNLFHDREGPLDDEQYADAAAVAHVAARTVLAWQSATGQGSVAWQLEQVPAHRAVIHQATGMIAVQTDMPIDDAIVSRRGDGSATWQPRSLPIRFASTEERLGGPLPCRSAARGARGRM
jgi:hypothetical protein